jgi:hypothetical protein
MMTIGNLKRSIATLLLLAILTLLPTLSSAQEPNPVASELVELRVGYGYSDNITRANDNHIESGSTILGINADWEKDRPLYSISLLSDLEYIYYGNSILRDRPNGTLNLRLTTHVIEDHLDWYVYNDFMQVREDINLGDSPDNLRRFNVLGTGIDGQASVGDRTYLGLTASFGDRNGETGLDIDSQEFAGGFSINRRLSATRLVGLVANVSRVEYDDVLSTEYDIARVFVRYQSELASGNVDLDVGANRIDNNRVIGDDDVLPMFRLTWRRNISARSSLELSGGYQITDLGMSSSDAGGDTGILNPTSAPFEETRAQLALTTNYERSSIRLTINASDQKYDSIFVEDFSFYSIGFGFERRLSPDLILRLQGSYGDRQSDQPLNDSRDVFASLGVRKSLGRRYAIAVSYQYGDRDAYNGSDYIENQYRIDLIAGLRN